jgi:solute carrier family 8 (sodium/calcium exchanger)
MIEFFMSTKKPTYGSQFKNAILLGPRINDENLIVEDVTLTEALMHFATVFWKVLFALVPPPHWGGGWPAFLIALSFIGAVTAIVGEVASLLGCVVGMEDSITAITFVALGTSLPDTFASITAA